MRLAWAALLLIGITAPARAQQSVWVFLRPDVVRGEVVRGVRERAAFPNDRAIPKAVLKKIADTGAQVRYPSRWLQAVSVDANANAMAKLRTLPEVTRLARMGLFMAARPARTARTALMFRSQMRAPSSLAFDSAFYGPNWWAIKMLGIPASQALGFTGKGIKIAILDTGFEPSHEALSTRTLLAQRDFIYGDNNVRDEPGDSATGQEQHGTWTWSVLGGYMPGRIVGPAFDASFILAKVDYNDPGNADDKAIDEDRWVAAVEWADSQGARLISSSLAYRDFQDKPDYLLPALNGDVTLAARMADEAARRGILIVNAMGNVGPSISSLWSPADADSVLSVGAVDSLGRVASFSSRGPTGDGRIKPEVSAPGVGIFAAASIATSSYNSGLNGTSFSTPYVGGLAAMFMQAWPNLGVMAIRNALMLSGSRADAPDNNFGFGIPNVSFAILFPEGLFASSIASVTTQNELTTIQPTFTWSAPLVNSTLRPVRYHLQIARDTTFANVIYGDTVSEAFTLTLKRPLLPATQLYWRVVAEASSNVTVASRPSGPFSMPHWVKLLTFSSSTTETTDSVRPLLRWDALSAPPPSGPLVFDVQILDAQTGAVIQTMRDITGITVQPDQALTPNMAYRWRVIARSPLGVADTIQSAGTFTLRQATSTPAATVLYQNFPNPFPRAGATTTRVWFDVKTRTSVELAIYDLHGRLVRKLVPSSSSCGDVVLDPGEYGRAPVESNPCIAVTWDAHDGNGEVVPRGVYILRLRAMGFEQAKKIVYLGS